MSEPPRPIETDQDDERTRPAGGDRAAAADQHRRSVESGTASELVADDLAVGYVADDPPVVECDQVVFPAGEVTAVVGPNGSGKSTLLKALAGQLPPRAGTVTVDEDAVYALGEKARARRIGLLSQERDSPGSVTVEDLVTHGRYPYRRFLSPIDETDAAAIDRAIELTGIDHLRTRELDALSGGQAQLAWVAMVLAQEPDVLLLDEPTTFLDLRHQLQVLETVRDLNETEGVTVGLVLHDIEQAARYADNLVALHDGVPYDWGPAGEVVSEVLLAEVFGVDATVRTDDGRPPEILAHGPIGE